jgi:hypothetical protein
LWPFSPEIKEIIELYTLFQQAIETLGLNDLWDLKPLLDVSRNSLTYFRNSFVQGNEMCTQLGISKGPLLGLLKEEQFRWQLQNPCGSAVECCNFLRDFIVAQNFVVKKTKT